MINRLGIVNQLWTKYSTAHSTIIAPPMTNATIIAPPPIVGATVKTQHGVWPVYLTDSNLGWYDSLPNELNIPNRYPVIRYYIKDNIASKTLAKKALDGMIVQFYFGSDNIDSSNSYGIRADPDGYFRFTTNDFRKATEFIIKVLDDSTVQLINRANGAVLFMDLDDDESMKWHDGSRNTNDSSFSFCSDFAGQKPINLSQLSLGEFIITVKNIRGISARPLCPRSSWRSWSNRCDNSGENIRLRMVIIDAGTYYRTFESMFESKDMRAKCCNGKASNDVEIDFCKSANMLDNTDTCDIEMADYCNIHGDSPYCGCYPQNVDAEAQKLPKDLSAYADILKAQPRCWVKGCSTGYIPKNLRDMNQCSITICKQDVSVSGQSNIVQDLEGRMFCQGGVPIQKAASPNQPPTNSANQPTNSANQQTNPDLQEHTTKLDSTDESEPNKHTNLLIMIIIFVFLALLSGIGIYYSLVALGSENTNYSDNDAYQTTND